MDSWRDKTRDDRWYLQLTVREMVNNWRVEGRAKKIGCQVEEEVDTQKTKENRKTKKEVLQARLSSYYCRIHCFFISTGKCY